MLVILGYGFMAIHSHMGVLGEIYTPSTAYNDASILLLAIFLFETFRRAHFPVWIRKLGNICAPYAFGVFLIHAQYDIYTLIEGKFAFIGKYHALLHIPLIVICSSIIFLACCILDYMRALLFKLLNVKILVQRLLHEDAIPNG